MNLLFCKHLILSLNACPPYPVHTLGKTPWVGWPQGGGHFALYRPANLDTLVFPSRRGSARGVRFPLTLIHRPPSYTPSGEQGEGVFRCTFKQTTRMVLYFSY